MSLTKKTTNLFKFRLIYLKTQFRTCHQWKFNYGPNIHIFDDHCSSLWLLIFNLLVKNSQIKYSCHFSWKNFLKLLYNLLVYHFMMSFCMFYIQDHELFEIIISFYSFNFHLEELYMKWDLHFYSFGDFHHLIYNDQNLKSF